MVRHATLALKHSCLAGSIEFQQDISAKQQETSSLKAQHAKAMDDLQQLRCCVETNKENYACQIKGACHPF
jgi:hypothetical protein